MNIYKNERMFMIWHDNATGDHSRIGYTEYSLSEVWAKGGINALLDEYRANGAYVERWQIVVCPF